MEITLEKIELVVDRTGVTYKEAKEALENAGGSVVDAIIDIEEKGGTTSGKDDNVFADSDIFARVRETISKGNMSRIMVKKDGETILNLPLNAGVLGALIAPWGVIFGAIAAAGFNCKVEFVNDKGEVTDINGIVKEQYDKAVQTGQEAYDKIKESDIYNKGQETYDKIKESDIYSKGQETFESFKENAPASYDELKEKSQSAFEDFKEKNQSAFEDFKEKNPAVFDNIEEIRQKSADLFKRNTEATDAVSKAEDTFEELGNKLDADMDELSKILEEVKKDSEVGE